MHVARRYATLSLVPAAAIAALGAGCDDPTLVGQRIPTAEVRTVEAYGRVLDRQAGPKDVVFVLLQAVRDDIQTARSRDKEAHRWAFDVQSGLAAPEAMYGRYQRSLQRNSMPIQITRDEAVYKLVKLRAPLLSHYAESFDTDYQTAADKMLVYTQPDGKVSVVLYDVRSASGDSEATVKVEFAKEQDYWRISRISYSDTSVATMRPGRSASSVAPAPATRPAGE